jgi:frataxin-like iron-binding protein CyaY
MIISFNNFIFEKSSLTKLGVPNQVMKNIQRDFALKSNADWIEVSLKKEMKNILIKNENRLIIEIQPDIIKVLVSVYQQGKKLYIIDKYTKKTGDWGDNWVKLDREGTTLTQLLDEIVIEKNSKHFLLNSYDFAIVKKDIRQIKKQEIEFKTFNDVFKKDLINYFTKLLKNSYSETAKRVEETIIDNLASTQKDLSNDQIRNILYQNVESAKKLKRFKEKSKNIDFYELDNPDKQYNSLSIFDEYLLNFENEYSEKYDKYLNIYMLVEKYSRMKILTAFIYYLYTGLLMDLDGYKNYKQIDDLSDLENLADNDF